MSLPDNRHGSGLEVKASIPAASVAENDIFHLEGRSWFCSASPSYNLFCILEPLLRIISRPCTPRSAVTLGAVPALAWPLTLQWPVVTFDGYALFSLTLVYGSGDGICRVCNLESVDIDLFLRQGLDGLLPLSTNVSHVVADDASHLAQLDDSFVQLVHNLLLGVC